MLKEKKIKIYRNEEIEDRPFPEVQSYKLLTERPTDLADINETEGGKLTAIESGAMNLGDHSIDDFGEEGTDYKRVTTDQRDIVDDDGSPDAPTGLSTTAGIQYVLLEWARNTETDFDYYAIWRNTVNNSATAVKVGENKTTLMVDGGLTGDQVYYYWLKAELSVFCRDNKISPSGSKKDLQERIEYYLKTGKNIGKKKRSNPLKNHNKSHDPISLEKQIP